VALVEFHGDFRRVAFALERIADALDRAIPMKPERVPLKPAVFINVNPADIADAEEEAERRALAGTEDSA
jgi:hypothetical protein